MLCPDCVYVKRDFYWYEILSRRMLDIVGSFIWSVPEWRERAFLRGDGVHYLACSPDGRFLVSGSSDTTLTVWDVNRVTNR